MGNTQHKGGGKKKGKGKNAGEMSQFEFVPEDCFVQSIWKHFKEVKILGRGASCSVSLVNKKDGGESFALKIMKKDDKWNPILFRQEYEILSALNHNSILRYREAWVDTKNFYICTELCTGGELFDRIKDLKHFEEKEASKAMRQILSAMEHCHTKNIVHRDLKPENIVYSDDNYQTLVIIDFGDAKVVEDDTVYDDFVGTAFYLAPECVRNRRGWELKASDLWTMGVIAYVILTGRPPFWGRDNREILRRILKGKLTFPRTIKLSKTCREFISRLIRHDPKKRMNASEALKHPWISGGDGSARQDVEAPPQYRDGARERED